MAALAVPLLCFTAGSASAQNFLANKKFDATQVGANSTAHLTFDLFNATEGNLSATLTDTMPATVPSGQLWFSPVGGATVTNGSANTPTCTAGAVTYSDFFDPPTNSKARTIKITNAVVPPRDAGTADPNCQVKVPVYVGEVNADGNVTNQVPGANATGMDSTNQIFPSQDFSATVRLLAPVNPLPTTKGFTPDVVNGGASSTLTITVKNNTSNPAVALSGVGFTDTLPAGMTAAAAPTFSPTCGTATSNTVAGGGVVQMASATVAAGETCTVTVVVQTPSTTASLVNTIGAGGVTATGGFSNTVPAEATLHVRSQIKMTKAFGTPGDATTWHTVDAPVPPHLYGEAFNTSASATAKVNQPVPVRVYFSNPTNMALTGGAITDRLPGNTVSVEGPVTGSCGNLPAATIPRDQTTVSISGFSVPAGSSQRPSSCYIEFYVKTTAVTNSAINALSVAAGTSDVTFAGTGVALFPAQATSATLTTTSTGSGPGIADGTVTTSKSFVTKNGVSYTGSALGQAAHAEKTDQFWMHVAVRNTTFDVNYENGSIVDGLPAGLRVASPFTYRIMKNPPQPFGDDADVAYGGLTDGCRVPGTVSVSGKTITYSGWSLRNAAPPNNTSPRNLGCFYAILLETDGSIGSDSINTIGANDVSATVDGTARKVNATADVAARIIVRSDLDTTKSFSPSTINMGPGAKTRLTINFANKAASPITSLAVTDPLPASAAFGTLTVASPANPSNTCGGSLTAAPGATSVVLAGGTVAANASCQIEVDVVRTGGTVGNASVTNTIAANGVTNAQGQTNWEPVTAPLSKSGTVGVNLVKNFAQSSALGGRSVPLILDFTTTTGSNIAQDAITLTDNLPAGMQVAQVPNMTTTCQKADGRPADVEIAADRSKFTISGFRFAAHTDGAVPHNRCSVTLNMVLTTTGNKTNTIPAGAITTDVFTTNPSPTQATLSTQPNTALSKQFNPGEAPAGQVSTLTLSIVNVNTVARTDFTLTDTFPAGMVVAGAGSTTCGDGVVTAAMGSGAVSISGGDVAADASCTITVPVKVSKEGVYVNDSSNINATAYIDKTETRDELKAGPPLPPSPTGIPTLSQWGLIVLSLLLAAFALRRVPLQAGRR